MVNIQAAVFGAGCFLGVEETFRTARGVNSTVVGYAGENIANCRVQELMSGKRA